MTSSTISKNQPIDVSIKRAVSPRLPALFLAWSPPSHTRRSVLMARELGIPLRRIHVLRKGLYLAPLRYAVQALLTETVLFRERPDVVFVQNPPVFAPLFVWIYCALTGAGMIIDSHTGALQERPWRWLLPLHGFLSRRAITTIVTNEHLSQIVASWGAQSQIIIDVPSELPAGKPYPVEHPFNVAMVSTFSQDEPLGEVLEVAERLPDVGFYVTGDPTWSSERLPVNLPSNIHLTGFLPDEEYYGLMRSVHAVMALTTQDHTMQRGACEAVWLGQPIITSDWPLLRRAFHKGTIHVDNSIEGIRNGVLQMRARYQQLAREIVLLQEERRQQWKETGDWLEALVLRASDGHGSKDTIRR
jgi:glycosyltransferase involved in cell wall biosynthesis